jgi:hypothetical protein
MVGGGWGGGTRPRHDHMEEGEGGWVWPQPAGDTGSGAAACGTGSAVKAGEWGANVWAVQHSAGGLNRFKPVKTHSNKIQTFFNKFKSTQTLTDPNKTFPRLNFLK